MSTEAALLAEIPPDNLLSREREVPRGRRNWSLEEQLMDADTVDGARRALLDEWQIQWPMETRVVGWTKLILQSIIKWLGRPPGAKLTFHLTQVLTGHGAFQSYLHRATSLVCIQCGRNEDNAEHTIVLCPY